jgi:hypothetical protein
MVPTMEEAGVPVDAKGWQADNINQSKVKART